MNDVLDWVGAIAAAWFLLSIALGLLLGAVMAVRNRQVPRPVRTVLVLVSRPAELDPAPRRLQLVASAVEHAS
jgi:hypothetical protein